MLTVNRNKKKRNATGKQNMTLNYVLLRVFLSRLMYSGKSHNRTERDTQGVGRDILIPKKLFLELCGLCENSYRLPS